MPSLSAKLYSIILVFAYAVSSVLATVAHTATLSRRTMQRISRKFSLAKLHAGATGDCWTCSLTLQSELLVQLSCALPPRLFHWRSTVTRVDASTRPCIFNAKLNFAYYQILTPKIDWTSRSNLHRPTRVSKGTDFIVAYVYQNRSILSQKEIIAPKGKLAFINALKLPACIFNP